MEDNLAKIVIEFDGQEVASFKEWLGYVQELEIPEQPATDWVERRVDASESYSDEIESFVEEIQSPTTDFPEICFKVSAALFGAGAPTQIWDFWNSIGTAGAIFSSNWSLALEYAMISNELIVLKEVPKEILLAGESAQVGFLYQLFHGDTIDNALSINWQTDFWFEVCSGILKTAIRNDRRYLNAYIKLYTKWWFNKMENWQDHQAFLFPDFEPILCSWIALLNEMGFIEESDLQAYSGFLAPAFSPKGEGLIQSIRFA